MARTRCPAGAWPRLSLPSHSGWRDGSAISSKIFSAGAAISRLALATFSVSSLMPVMQSRTDPPANDPSFLRQFQELTQRLFHRVHRRMGDEAQVVPQRRAVKDLNNCMDLH